MNLNDPNIPILNQPDPDAPIDPERLTEEFQQGLELFMDVPLSLTHLACLTLAAQRTLYQADCSTPVRAVLLDFLGWCSQHAEFGPETRKLVDAQAVALRAAGGMMVHGVQTPGTDEPEEPHR